MRLVGYARVSRVGGRSGEGFISPTEQRRSMQGWAKSNGATICEVCEDLDASGGSLQGRPEFERALSMIDRGEADGLIVARLDRLARDVPGAWEVATRISRAGGTLVSVVEGVADETATGEFTYGIHSLMAQYVRAQLKESWATSRRNAIERGLTTTTAPFGYTKENGGPLEPHPVEAPLVRDVFLGRARGESWKALAGRVNRKLGGDRVKERDVTRIVARRTYLGEARSGEFVKEGAHPAIVTLAEFEAANAMRGSAGDSKARTTSLLSGLVRCAGCRFAMKTDTLIRKGKRTRRYRCSNMHCGERAVIVTEGVDYLAGEYLLTYAGLSHQEQDGDPAREQRLAVDVAERRLGEYRDDDAVRDALPREDWLVGLRGRSEALSEAREALDKAEREARASEVRVRVLGDEWDGYAVAERRALLYQALDAVFVRKGGGDDRLRFYWKGECPFELPKRGTRFEARPIDWPEDPWESIPKWARLDRHRLGPGPIRDALIEAGHDVGPPIEFPNLDLPSAGG